MRFKIGEIDILAYDKKNDSLVIIEVRGRTKKDPFLPSQFLNHKKIERLKKIAAIISSKQKKTIRIELLEVFFQMKKYPKALLKLSILFPKLFGVKWNAYEI